LDLGPRPKAWDGQPSKRVYPLEGPQGKNGLFPNPVFKPGNWAFFGPGAGSQTLGPKGYLNLYVSIGTGRFPRKVNWGDFRVPPGFPHFPGI